MGNDLPANGAPFRALLWVCPVVLFEPGTFIVCKLDWFDAGSPDGAPVSWLPLLPVFPVDCFLPDEDFL